MLENAPTLIHPHTKEKHIWVMKISLSNTSEEIHEDARKRQIESTQNVQGLKKPKLQAKNQDDSQEKELVVKDLPVLQVNRVVKLLPAGEDKKLEVNPRHIQSKLHQTRLIRCKWTGLPRSSLQQTTSGPIYIVTASPERPPESTSPLYICLTKF